MHRMNIKKVNKNLCLMTFALGLVSCGGPFTRLSKPDYSNSKQGYAVNLPVGWVQFTSPQANDALVISKDGFSLQSINIEAHKQDKAFETIKKTVTATTPIIDLAELELAEFKAKNPNAASVKVIENSLANLSGQPAYKLHLQYLNDKGLRFERLVYGFSNTQYVYRLSYVAPTLHYFQRDLAAFQKVVNDFKLTTQ